MAAALAYAFYGVMFAALAYFLHRMAWLARYRTLSTRMVRDALAKLSEREAETLDGFERRADASWTPEEVAELAQKEPPDAYVERIEANLEEVRALLRGSEQPITEAFVAAVVDGERPETPMRVLRVPRLHDKAERIELPLALPTPKPLEAPPTELYSLELRSRYGLLPRVLAFFLGAADVVYSTHHVTEMGQSGHVPAGLLLRRLSLVAVVLGAVLLDIALGARSWLIARMETLLAGLSLPASTPLRSWLQPELPTLAGLGAWLLAYGTLYFGLYLFLRSRSHAHVRRLEQMRARREADVAELEATRDDELAAWAEAFGATLDGQVRTTAQQAELLTERAIQRLRRRLAPDILLDASEELAEALFQRLPESRHDLSSEQRRRPSFGHSLWPRASEMRHDVRVAEYRAAHRELSRAATELRSERPDPHVARGLWSAAHRYAIFFDALVPEGTADRLSRAYAATLAGLVEETEADLEALDAHLAELARSLRQRFEVVPELVESRVELAEQAGEAALARLTAEVLKVRESARLEAMAFEI